MGDTAVSRLQRKTHPSFEGRAQSFNLAQNTSSRPLDVAQLEDRTLYSATPVPIDSDFLDPDAPTISQIEDQVVAEDEGVGSFAFQLADSDTDLDQLTVAVESSNPDLIPLDNILLEGSGQFRSITLDTVDDAFGSTEITLIVSDGEHATSMSFDVTVTPVNDAPTTVGLPDIRVNALEGTAVVDLFAAFEDVEDADEELTFAVHHNTNTSLFESIHIDQSSGTLTLTFAQDASGSADLTIVATDSEGASVSLDPTDTTIPVYDRIAIGLPTTEIGMERLDFWTAWTLFDYVDGEYQFDHLARDKFISFLEDESFHDPDVPIVFNVESEYYTNTAEGRDRFAEIFSLAQQYQPDLDFGVYRIMPEKNWYAPIDWARAQHDLDAGIETWFTRRAEIFEENFLAWQERNLLYRTQPVSETFGGTSLAELTDTVNPSLYAYFRNDEHKLISYFEASVDGAANTLTMLNGENFDTVEKIRILPTTDGQLPAGLSQWTQYYLVNTNGNQFQISATEGGPAIDLDDAYTGTFYASPLGPWENIMLDPDVTGWATWVELSISEARKFGKPVNAWISPSLLGAGDEYVSKEFFRFQLDTVAELADGIVIWDGSGGLDEGLSFHENSEWWAALNEFMDDHRLTMPTFNITVEAAPPAPVAGDDAFTLAEDASLDLLPEWMLSNDSDASDAELNPQLVRGPKHGTLTIEDDGSWHYVPEANFHGTDSFAYQVSNGQQLSNVAQVTLEVTSVNDAPIAVDDSFSTIDTTVLVISQDALLANDDDVDGDTLTITIVEGPLNGQLTVGADGGFEYLAEAGFAGLDTFVYQVADKENLTSLATATIQVTASEDPGLPPDDGSKPGKGKDGADPPRKNPKGKDAELKTPSDDSPESPSPPPSGPPLEETTEEDQQSGSLAPARPAPPTGSLVPSTLVATSDDLVGDPRRPTTLSGIALSDQRRDFGEFTPTSKPDFDTGPPVVGLAARWNSLMNLDRRSDHVFSVAPLRSIFVGSGYASRATGQFSDFDTTSMYRHERALSVISTSLAPYTSTFTSSAFLASITNFGKLSEASNVAASLRESLSFQVDVSSDSEDEENFQLLPVI